MDPQILRGPSYERYLKRLDWCKPAAVDVLEIYHFEYTKPVIKFGSADNNYLQKWLERPIEIPADQQGKEAVGGLRMILGPSTQHILANDIPAVFPHGMEDIFDRKPLPFPRHILEMIIEKFHLPVVTPWVLFTKSSHFQKHSINSEHLPTHFGYTMRRSTRGILAMNISLSLSYEPTSGMTYGLLLGCSDIQQAFILEQIRTLAAHAIHPMLLPVLFSAHQQQLLNRERKQLWVSLLKVETESGQTGAPVINSHMFQTKVQDYDHITKCVLGVIQIASAWESYSKALILGIDTVQESLIYLECTVLGLNKAKVEAASATFKEWLTFVRHRSNVMLWDFEFIEKRAQAQMTAVHSYIAQRDAQLGQKLSEYSTVLAADSREIAAASKRDSSAMKGIAFLTMVFLPGTYVATFFAMPLLDFSTPTPTSKPGFWIYWAVTAPLTICVLIIYLTYLARVSHKNREEDKRARKELHTKKESTTSPRSNRPVENCENKGFLSILFEVLPGKLSKSLVKKSEPNPESGITGGTEMMQLPSNDNIRRRSTVRLPVAFKNRLNSGTVSLYQNPAAEPFDREPTSQNDRKGLGRAPRISRPMAFQSEPTSDSDVGLEADEILEVSGGTEYYPPPEASISRRRQLKGPNIATETADALRRPYTLKRDLDSDSDSSFGL